MAEATIFMANGTEECEALLVVDLLRRAQISISMISIEATEIITGSHNIKIVCDGKLADYGFSGERMLILPGGMAGTNAMKAKEKLKDVFTVFQQSEGYSAAICAAPTVLAAYGVLGNRRTTVYPGMQNELQQAQYTGSVVEQDGTLITARALGAAIPFSLKLIENLRDQATADQVAKAIVYKE